MVRGSLNNCSLAIAPLFVGTWSIVRWSVKNASVNNASFWREIYPFLTLFPIYVYSLSPRRMKQRGCSFEPPLHPISPLCDCYPCEHSTLEHRYTEPWQCLKERAWARLTCLLKSLYLFPHWLIVFLCKWGHRIHHGKHDDHKGLFYFRYFDRTKVVIPLIFK